MPTTFLELSATTLYHNLAQIRTLIGPKTLLAPCIKSNAYGHGMVATASIMVQAGADWFCVSNLSEATKLRQAAIQIPILVLGPVEYLEFDLLTDPEIRVTVHSYELATQLNQWALSKHVKVKVHLKCDTGMSRLGILAAQFLEFLIFFADLPALEVEGVYTHFATSDELDSTYFQKQIDSWQSILQKIQNAKLEIPIIHSCNSGALIQRVDLHQSLVRPGILSYGLCPSDDIQKLITDHGLNFQPALSFNTSISSLKTIPEQTSVSYGSSFTTSRQTKIAVLPVGYADGLNRRLSHGGQVMIRGQLVPVIGRVCMNMTMVDVTDLADVQVNDEVILIGVKAGIEVTVNDWAELTGSINYEVLTCLPAHITRITV